MDIFLHFLFQLDDVAPTCGGIFTLEVVFDGVGKHIGLAFPAFVGILLTAQHDGFWSIDFIDFVNYLIQTMELVVLLAVDVKQVLLDGWIGADAVDDDACFLILIIQNS